jgi:hypothetical protein
MRERWRERPSIRVVASEPCGRHPSLIVMKRALGLWLMIAAGLVLLPMTACTETNPSPPRPPTVTSAPNPRVVVPRVVGLNWRSARKVARNVGLSLDVNAAGDLTRTTIRSQIPTPGSVVQLGTVVHVLVGPPPRQAG